jgi:serine/threonine protein kinase
VLHDNNHRKDIIDLLARFIAFASRTCHYNVDVLIHDRFSNINEGQIAKTFAAYALYLMKMLHDNDEMDSLAIFNQLKLNETYALDIDNNDYFYNLLVNAWKDEQLTNVINANNVFYAYIQEFVADKPELQKCLESLAVKEEDVIKNVSHPPHVTEENKSPFFYPTHHQRKGKEKESTMVINPLNQLDPAMANVLLRYLNQEVKAGKVEFQKGKYAFESYLIDLPYDLIYRPKKDFRTGEIISRYSVVSDEVLGSGTFGEVRMVLGTLKETKDERQPIQFKKGKERAIKKLLHVTPKHETPAIAKREAKMMRSALHTHSKPLTQVKGEAQRIIRSYLVMRKFKGKNLRELKGGCDLYIMKALPKNENLIKYKNSYILVGEELTYIKDDATVERDIIGDNKKFLEGLQDTVKGKPKKIPLSGKQVKDLITSNGGHAPLKKDIESLSYKERLILSRNILRALQEQIHDRGLLHRDIKPENIIVDLETMEVNFVDFGSSVKAKTKINSGASIGTAQYMSAEALLGDAPIDSKSDISSIALTIAVSVWHAKARRFNQDFIEEEKRKTKKRGDILRECYRLYAEGDTNKVKELDELFNNIDIDEDQKRSINSLIIRMISRKKEERPSLDEAMSILDDLMLAEMDKNEEHDAVKAAHRAGQLAYNQLHQIARYRDYPIERPEHASNSVERVITEALESQGFIETPEAVSEFIATLGVSAFVGLTTKNQIREKTTQIIDEFHHYTQTLLAMMKKAEKDLFLIENITPGKKSKVKDELRAFIEDIEIVLGRDKKHLVKLDDICAQNAYFKKRIDDFTNAEYGRQRHLNLPDRRFTDIEASSHPHIAGYLEDYKRILNGSIYPSGNTELDDLKDKIKLAVRNYVILTLSDTTIRTKDRSASKRRVDNMNAILDAANEATDPNDLIRNVNNKLKDIQSGHTFFGNLFGHSLLRAKVSNVIKDYQKKQQHSKDNSKKRRRFM